MLSLHRRCYLHPCLLNAIRASFCFFALALPAAPRSLAPPRPAPPNLELPFRLGLYELPCVDDRSDEPDLWFACICGLLSVVEERCCFDLAEESEATKMEH